MTDAQELADAPPEASAPAGPVTLASIARDAGVSVSVVSKVLNGRGDVSERTRARVAALLDAQGYRRRFTVMGRTPLVELVFHEFDSDWALELFRGVNRVAAEHGLNVVVTESGALDTAGPQWIDAVLRRRPAAAVLVLSALPTEAEAALRGAEIPFVLIDPTRSLTADVPTVGATDWTGGLMATRHLIELGHRRIGIITGPADMMSALARLDGYRSALVGAGIAVDERLVRYGDFHVAGGLTAATELLALPDPPTAIFAGNDLQAAGTIEAARLAGRRVPDDLSIIGYDDINVAQWASPPLTTIRQPLARMAEEATRMVLDGGDDRELLRVDFGVRLIQRASTAPRRA